MQPRYHIVFDFPLVLEPGKGDDGFPDDVLVIRLGPVALGTLEDNGRTATATLLEPTAPEDCVEAIEIGEYQRIQLALEDFCSLLIDASKLRARQLQIEVCQ